MSDWKQTYNNEINNMWNYMRRTMAGVCVICDVCGDGSKAFCECAKQRFVNNLTLDKLKYFIDNGTIKWN
jgi:hypothetical protein